MNVLLKDRSHRSGISLLETITVIAIIAVIATGIGLNLVGRRGKSDLDNTTKQIVGTLREAQSRAIAQASSTSWGVRFYSPFPGTGRPYFELVATAGTQYATGTGRYPLPETLVYDTSTFPQPPSCPPVPGCSYAKIMSYSEIYGAGTSSTIRLHIKDNPALSSTIRVASSGLVSY